MVVTDKIQLRAGSSASATSADPILDAREIALTDDRTAGVGDVRGFLGDAASNYSDFDPRGIWATPSDVDAIPGGGDASTNTSSSVVGEAALFADTTGKLLKRATGSGIVKRTSGVDSTVTAPSGAIVGDTDTQTLTNKTLSSGTNTFPTFNQNTSGTAANLSGTPALPNGTTATTQSAADNSTKLATTAYVDTGLGGKQALDSDLTTIAGLTATTDNFIVSVSSAWASRTPAQVKTTLAIAESDVTSLVSDLAAKAPLASPTFTGTVTLPTGLSGLAKLTSGVVSAVTAPSGAVVGTTDTQTLTNKRRQPRVNSQASTSTLTPEVDTYEVFRLTAQAAALTIANHSTSTPADGEQMRISILDNGTARAISFGTNYVARGGIALPTTTTISKLLTLGFEWYADLSKFVLTALAQEA